DSTGFGARIAPSLSAFLSLRFRGLYCFEIRCSISLFVISEFPTTNVRFTIAECMCLTPLCEYGGRVLRCCGSFAVRNISNLVVICVRSAFVSHVPRAVSVLRPSLLRYHRRLPKLSAENLRRGLLGSFRFSRRSNRRLLTKRQHGKQA